MPGTSVASRIDFTNDLGGVGDGLLIADATMAASSAVCTSASALFTSAAVGKPIVVATAGTGGNDLHTTILSYQSASQVTLAAACNASGVGPVGAIWGTDNGPALQTGLDSLATTGGGVLTVGQGNFCIFTGASHADYGVHNTPFISIEGTDTASLFYVATGSGNNMLAVGNLGECKISNLGFVGCPLANSDAANTIVINSTQVATIRDCLFLGLATGSLSGDANNLGIVSFTATDLRLLNCQFRGCVGANGKGNSAVHGFTVFGLEVNGCVFFDWGWLNGIQQTAYRGESQAWVQVNSYQTPIDNANAANTMRFINSRFDEYTNRAINLYPGAGSVELDGCMFNVTWDNSGGGVLVQGANSFLAQNCLFGYRTKTGILDSITLQGVTAAHLKNIVCTHNTTQITVSNTCTNLLVEDCPTITTITSSATKTEIRQGGGPVTPGTRFGFLWSQPFTTTLTANKVYYACASVPSACTLTGIVVSTGSGSGNLQVGLYSANGQILLASSASVAQTNSGGQSVPFSSPIAVPGGLYWIAVQASSASQNFNQALPLGGSSAAAQGSFALPTTITPPTTGVQQMPIMSTY